MYVKLAIPRPVDTLFDYEYDEGLLGPVRVGDLVRVSFGRSKLNACVVEISKTKPKLREGVVLKSVSEKLSDEFSMTGDVFKMCQFGAEYYQYPIGEAFFIAVPPKPEKALGTRGDKRTPVTELRNRELNDEQKEALASMLSLSAKNAGPVFLLEGVTGSGKTEVYIEFARKVLAEGKSVLILVPEIALTAHLRERFEHALGERIALWHSALSDGLRQDQFKKVRSGEIRVVVGARSAVFAPFKNLGLIVIDEEHDQTYKQEERFRYQARDLALYRAKVLKIPVVLGSATPSLETLQRMKDGKVHHLELKKRFSTKPLPEIEFVSLLEEPTLFHEKVKSPLAEKTITRMQEAIDRGEQVMVFLNRRGFSQFILCQSCGWIKKCTNCSISMTHYQRKNELRCHVCAMHTKVPVHCESCQSQELVGMGSGTESLEDELQLVLRDAKILRLDRDQVTSQTRLEKVLDSFRNLEANVLIGTQMLVKGHDFPKVTCVVVMMADMLLKWPDFRASERALQTLVQVAGRAGRAELPGKVIIQGYDLDHPVLKILKGEVTRESFFEEELELRAVLRYPPFSRFVRYRFEGTQQGTLKAKVEKIAEVARNSSENKDVSERMMGPSEALLFKAKNLFRYDLYYKASSIDALFRMSRSIKHLAELEEIDLIVDVDPYSS